MIKLKIDKRQKDQRFFSYNFFPKNRKGEKIISVYWFAILFIVAAAVVSMVVIFYGKPYDIRELESNALTNHVADCLSEGGYLKKDVLGNDDFKSNFLENCDLNFNVEDIYNWKEQEQYYIKVEFFQDDKLVFDISEGNKNIVSSCGIEKEIEEERLAKCVEREFYSLNAEDVYLIKILSIVRKTEKNVI